MTTTINEPPAHLHRPARGDAVRRRFGIRSDERVAAHVVRFPYDHPRPPGPLWANVWGDHLLQRTYGAFFNHAIGERVMPWLSEAVGKLSQSFVCNGESITIPALATDPTLPIRVRSPGSEASLQTALESGQFLPLAQLLSPEDPPPLTWPAPNRDWSHPRPGFTYYFNGRILLGPGNKGFTPMLPSGTFIDEAEEFVQFGLFGENGRYRQAFIQFATASANGPVDEAAFAHFFGQTEDAFLRRLWGFTAAAKDQTYPLPPRKMARPVAACNLVFRTAEVAELQAMSQVWQKARQQSRQWSDGEISGTDHISVSELSYAFRTLY